MRALKTFSLLLSIFFSVDAFTAVVVAPYGISAQTACLNAGPYSPVASSNPCSFSSKTIGGASYQGYVVCNISSSGAYTSNLCFASSARINNIMYVSACDSSDFQVGDQCQDTPLLDCSSSPISGQISDSLGESCICPSGKKEGYIGSVSSGLSKSCIPNNPDPDPDLPECTDENAVGYVNGQPVCNSPSCPDGYQSGYVGDDHVCLPDPAANPNDCPAGSSWGTFQGLTKCWESSPNISDPDYTPNLNGENSPVVSDGSGQLQTKNNLDDSRIVGRLDALNDKANKTNDTLDEINDALNNSGDPLPDHTDTTNNTVSGAASSFRSRIASSPLVSTFSGFANLVSVSNASCPDLTIDLTSTLGQEISTTMHCDLYDVISVYLTTVMLVIYSFIGFRIFASA